MDYCAIEDQLKDKQHGDGARLLELSLTCKSCHLKSTTTSAVVHRRRPQKDVQRTTWSTRLWLPLQRYTKLDSLIPRRVFTFLNATSLAKLNAFQQLVTDTDSVGVVIIFQLTKSLSQNVSVTTGS